MRYLFVTFLLLAVVLYAQNPLSASPSASRTSNSIAVAPPQFSVPLVANIHGLWSFGLNFGVDPTATKGIDAALGEMEYPPLPPPGAWLFMFSTDGGNAILDLRPSTGTAQVDTYAVAFSPDAEMYPITFSWPSLAGYYSGPVRLKYDLNGSQFDIDMMAQNSYTMATGPVNNPDDPPFLWTIAKVYIIAQGPLAKTSLPVVSTFGLGNGGFQAVVNAPPAVGATPNSILKTTAGTSTWFEYGATMSYGNSTAPQLVSDGTSQNVSSIFDTSAMSPNSRIHVRAVAQNVSGTYYGGDRIVSRGNPSAEVSTDTTKYRTASYRDWADAVDQKFKRKSIKCKPDKVDFSFILQVPPPSSSSDPFTRFRLNFNMPIQTLLLFRNAVHTDTITCVPTTNGSKSVQMFDLNTCLPLPDSILFEGRGTKGKPVTVKYTWFTTNSQNKNGLSGTLPTKPRPQLDDRMIYNYPRLPMPNLHNVGEGIFGGIRQTPMIITIGSSTDPRGAHTVYHLKYSDVVKSLIKERMGGGSVYHTAAGRCLDKMDGGKILKTAIKSLPPDRFSNLLFANQLTLKLSLAASDSGLFPQGLGDLIFDNSEESPGPFDGMTVRAIVDSVDRFLGCNGTVAGTGDALVFQRVDSLINAAFAGPMDTVSWSCAKLVCTGVRPLNQVPYLHENPAPNAHPKVSNWAPQPYTQPKEFRLEQNYPNPFNPVTTIQFDLPVPAIVTLKIYNALGQEVATLIENESMDEGTQTLDFDAGNLASGVYFYRIAVQYLGQDGEGVTGERFVQTMKMLLVK